MTPAKGTEDEDIGRPGPWREDRYQQRDKPADESVRQPPGSSPNPNVPASTPVTRKDYEFPDEDRHTDEDGDTEPPGGDAG
jgi:hypothetical protein